jgi:class 3 adenylate cyclase/tetratricopeptide (TPR) repeat protein
MRDSPLHSFLEPALQAHLISQGELPPETRVALATTLRQNLIACAAYIPGRLVSTQLADPMPGRISGAFWDGSLLFADLSGFTALSEQLSLLGKQGAEEVSGVVNRLFEALVAEVLDHQGTLLKFGGDALTAFFDVKTLGPLHAVAATLAALAMQERMQAFSALKTRKGTFCLRLRVGVHSGKVFAAEVGDTSHIELVVTGPEVNRVATAQEIAAPGEVVISDHTAALLEGATLAPRTAGFQSITALPSAPLPEPPPAPIQPHGPDDMATLEQLAAQFIALRPYLVRNMPGRFLDATVFEMGEFRPVSVLFANFHDFSAILTAPGTNADLAAHLLNAYYQRAQAVVHRYDGIVNKVDMYTHGDKLMALFGAPAAHEDDPLRAVRCALELQGALDEANAEIAERMAEAPLLGQHIGINVGTVFAGRVGGLRRYEYTVMGSAVNLAARLMAATEDGTILLSPATRKAVEHQVATREHAPLHLKGLSEPVIPAWALHLLEEKPRQRPTDNANTLRAPLVGRGALLKWLLDETATALHGNGRVLALVGEAGIGKSRVVEELIRHADEQRPDIPPFQLISGDCQSHEQSMPYATIRPPLRHLLGITRHATPETSTSHTEGPFAAMLSQIEQVVERYTPDMLRFAPLLGDVFGLPFPETPLTRALSDEQRHDRLHALLVALFKGAAAHARLLLSLEDIQWADASSLTLIDHLARAISQTPLLLLLNYRPDPPIAEPWDDLATTTRLELRELPPEESTELLAALLNGFAPPEVLPLLERTQGNPFFIEELVRALITSEALERNEQNTWQLTRPLEQVALPTSIEGLIFARLDQLDEPRSELVQVASVVGRRFQHPLIEHVYNTPTLLENGLTYLVGANIIIPEEPEPYPVYIFRHALLRDVAYESILYARRRELHRRVAQRIEDISFGQYEENLTLLAQHYLLAESWMLAFYYHKEAGIHAQKRYANREALALFANALAIVPHMEQEMAYYVAAPTLPAEEDHVLLDSPLFSAFIPLVPLPVQIAELHERCGYLYALLGETDQAEHAYLQALSLINQASASQESVPTSTSRHAHIQAEISRAVVRIHRHIAALYEQRANYEKASEWLERGMTNAGSETHHELVRCYLLRSRIAYSQGEFDQSLEWAQYAHYVAEHLEDTFDLAQSLLRMGNLWAEQGDLAQSIPALEQAYELFEQGNHLARLNHALNDLGAAYDDAGRWKEAINCYGRSLQISENIGDVIMLARASNNLALTLLGQGELQRANELYQYSCDQFQLAGSEHGVAITMINRGEVLLLQEKPDEALRLLQECITLLERINARLGLPEALRLAAEAALALDDYAQATHYAEHALATANELGMTMKEAMVRCVLGQIALSQHDIPTATAYLEQSHRELEHLDNAHELGTVIYWQGKLAHASGQQEQALLLLRQAEAMFNKLNAQRDLEKVQALLATIECPG